jgi:hypothetical protein
MNEQHVQGKAIACIGWGSLVHSPEDLPMRTDWRSDGPWLPIEFARESEGGHITLVICPALEPLRTYWCLLNVDSVEEACLALGRREYGKASATWIEKYIGFWSPSSQSGPEASRVAPWAALQALDGAVWTGLPCKFDGTNGRMPSADEVLEHLAGLKGRARETAEAYVRRAPTQTNTEYRRLIAQKLGWSETT